MPSKYKSNKERINEYLEAIIIPAIKKKDCDYYRVVNVVSLQTNASRKMVEEMIENLIQTKKLKEIRVLTICDEQVDDFLKEIREIEREASCLLEVEK